MDGPEHLTRFYADVIDKMRHPRAHALIQQTLDIFRDAPSSSGTADLILEGTSAAGWLRGSRGSARCLFAGRPTARGGSRGWWCHSSVAAAADAATESRGPAAWQQVGEGLWGRRSARSTRSTRSASAMFAPGGSREGLGSLRGAPGEARWPPNCVHPAAASGSVQAAGQNDWEIDDGSNNTGSAGPGGDAVHPGRDTASGAVSVSGCGIPAVGMDLGLAGSSTGAAGTSVATSVSETTLGHLDTASTEGASAVPASGGGVCPTVDSPQADGSSCLNTWGAAVDRVGGPGVGSVRGEAMHAVAGSAEGGADVSLACMHVTPGTCGHARRLSARQRSTSSDACLAGGAAGGNQECSAEQCCVAWDAALHDEGGSGDWDLHARAARSPRPSPEQPQQSTEYESSGSRPSCGGERGRHSLPPRPESSAAQPPGTMAVTWLGCSKDGDGGWTGEGEGAPGSLFEAGGAACRAAASTPVLSRHSSATNWTPRSMPQPSQPLPGAHSSGGCSEDRTNGILEGVNSGRSTGSSDFEFTQQQWVGDTARGDTRCAGATPPCTPASLVDAARTTVEPVASGAPVTCCRQWPRRPRPPAGLWVCVRL